jgi:hypothetical protein
VYRLIFATRLKKRVVVKKFFDRLLAREKR